jgi:hypothetical protein
VRDATDGVSNPRPGRGERNTNLPRGLGVTVRGVRPGLFVADMDEFYALHAHANQKSHYLTAVEAEVVLYTLFFQDSGDVFTALDRFFFWHYLNLSFYYSNCFDLSSVHFL